MEILCVPHFDELILMQLSPFSNELAAFPREAAIKDVEIDQLHDRLMLAVLDVNMARWMLAVDQEHPNDDSIETANLGHAL